MAYMQTSPKISKGYQLPAIILDRRLRRVSVLLVMFAIGVLALISKATESKPSTSDLLKLSLKELLNIKVETATGQQQSALEAPAIISVISKADIELWNYRSVGEALSQVAGLYAIGDYVSPNYGVRGINGGHHVTVCIVKFNGWQSDHKTTLTHHKI